MVLRLILIVGFFDMFIYEINENNLFISFVYIFVCDGENDNVMWLIFMFCLEWVVFLELEYVLECFLKISV